jgi:hypothetical protein
VLLGVTAAWHSTLRAELRHETAFAVDNHVSLVPLYTAKWKTVSPLCMKTVIAALKRTYMVTTRISEPDFYEGADEGVALLDYLSKRNRDTCDPESLLTAINGCHAASQPSERRRLMGVIRGPIRARVDGSSSLRYVCGFAYTPNDLEEFPTVTVITTHEFDSLPEEYAAHHLGIVAIHELGHNFGALDCKDRGCFMTKEIEWSSKSLPSRFCKHHSGLLWQYLR